MDNAFNGVSDELVLHVTSYLAPEDLLRLALTCSRSLDLCAEEW